jgi:hypothetical protein
MSLRPDGSYMCDRCGGSAGHGGVMDAAALIDMVFNEDGSAIPRNYHLCRVNGCATAVLSPANLPAYFA